MKKNSRKDTINGTFIDFPSESHQNEETLERPGFIRMVDSIDSIEIMKDVEILMKLAEDFLNKVGPHIREFGKLTQR